MVQEHEKTDVEPTECKETTLQAGIFDKFPRIPLVFLGLGFYRAWIEIAASTSYQSFPLQAFTSGEVFQLSAIIVWLVAAFFAKRFAPLSKGKGVFIVSGGILAVTTAGNYYTILNPQAGDVFALPLSVASGIAIALVILLWSEFFGCLNPLRVALYYSCSIIVGALLIYLSKGLTEEFLLCFKILLPVLSVLFAYLSFRKLPALERPQPVVSRFSFPWKPVLMMAIFSFAYGLKQSSVSPDFGPHSAIGVVAAAAIVFIAAISQGEKFNFSLLYRFGFPLMVASFLLAPDFGFSANGFSWFCAAFSYTAFSILIMILLSNMVYRYNMNALWLFGIERAIRQCFTFGGREVNTFVSNAQPLFENSALFVNVAIIMLVVATTMIVLSEKELASNWGVGIISNKDKPSGNEAVGADVSRSYELGQQCAALSRKNALSTREAEVLLLLAQKKSIGIIERELLIANGTAKSHVRHIYQKLDIHSREELFEMLEHSKSAELDADSL